MRIEDIDKNFKPTSACGEENVVFVDCLKSPIKLYGVIPPENDRNYFVRLPEDIAKNTNGIVSNVKGMTSIGGTMEMFVDKFVNPKLKEKIKEKKEEEKSDGKK